MDARDGQRGDVEGLDGPAQDCAEGPPRLACCGTEGCQVCFDARYRVDGGRGQGRVVEAIERLRIVEVDLQADSGGRQHV